MNESEKKMRGRSEERIKPTVEEAVAGFDALMGTRPNVEPVAEPDADWPRVRSRRTPKKKSL